MVGSYSEVHCDLTSRNVIEDLPQPPSPHMVMDMGIGGWLFELEFVDACERGIMDVDAERRVPGETAGTCRRACEVRDATDIAGDPTIPTVLLLWYARVAKVEA